MIERSDDNPDDDTLRMSRRDVVRSASITAMLAVTGTGASAASPESGETPKSPILGREGNVRWYRIGDNEGREQFRDAIPTANGGVTTVGLATVDAERTEVWQYGWNADGDKKWTAFQGGSGFDSAFGGAQTETGGYVLGGRSRMPGDNDQFYVVKTDSRGSEHWTQRFHLRRREDDRANDVVRATDGGYAATGVAGNCAALVKFTTDGTVEWTNTYSGDQTVEAVSVVATDDGYVLGGTLVHDDGTAEFLLLKTDTVGREQWRQTYAAGEDSRLSDCIPTGDGYLLAGTTVYEDTFTSDALFVRTDRRGNVVWKETYGVEGEEYTADSITATEDGFAFVGTRSADVIGPQLWLGGLNESGDRRWKYSFGTERPETPLAIETTNDGYVAVSGFINPTDPNDGSSGFVAKVELSGPSE